MRFKHYNNQTYKLERGDIKKENRFLLFPLRIGDETRWLEFVTIEYEWDLVHSATDGLSPVYTWRWIPKQFIDK